MNIHLHFLWYLKIALLWGRNGPGSVSNHQPHDCLLNRLFRRRSKKTSKLRVTDLCAGKSPGTGEFPAQMASNAENVSIWWRHHEAGANGWILSSWKTWIHLSCKVNDHNGILGTHGARASVLVLTHWCRDKWTPFHRRHFQTHCLEWKCLNFD